MQKKDSGIFHILPVLLIAVVIIVVVFFVLRNDSGDSILNPSNFGRQQESNFSKNTVDCKPRNHQLNRTNQAFAIDYTNNKTLYVGVEFEGVFKSTNDGKTWNKKIKGIKAYGKKSEPKEPCILEIGRIIIDPMDPNKIYFSRPDSPGTGIDPFGEIAGIFYSADKAENWEKISADWMNQTTYDLFVAGNGEILYGTAAMPATHSDADPNEIFVTKGLVYKTSDNGENWVELPTGVKKNYRAMRVHQQGDKIIVLQSFLPPNAANQPRDQIKNPNPIIISSNNGKTWQNIAYQWPSEYINMVHMSVSPHNINYWIAMPETINGSTSLYSKDGGKTVLESSPSELELHYVAYSPHEPSSNHAIGISAFMDGVWESKDAGATWTEIAKLPSDTEDNRVSNITWDPMEPNTIYINGDNAHVWKSSDSGKTWQKLMDLEILSKVK